MSDADPTRSGDATATGTRSARLPAVGSLIDHPFFGLERRRTAIALAYVVGVVVLFAVRYGARVVAVGDVPLETRWGAFDSLSALSIAVATVTITLVPLVYAAWNGGPGLSFALPFVPLVPPELVSGRYVLGLDWAIALSVGTVAAAVALYAAGVRRTGSSRPWRTDLGDDDALVFVTACLGIAVVLSGSFLTSVPAHVRERFLPFATLLVVPLAVAAVHWWARFRRRVAGPASADRDGRTGG